MKFYNKQHEYYCGIDLHAKTMYICIQDKNGEVIVHRNMRAHPEVFLTSSWNHPMGSYVKFLELFAQSR